MSNTEHSASGNTGDAASTAASTTTRDREFSSTAYVDAAFAAMQQVLIENDSQIRIAARIVSAVIENGGIIHSFGAGHSQAGAMELAGRAGGFVPTNRVSISDLVLRGSHPPAILDDYLLERREDIGRLLFDDSDVRASDGVVMMSNSGINGSVVEFALAVKETGVPLIAITSRKHSQAGESRHSTGSKLMDIADVVLDNGAPVGDSVLSTSGATSVGAISSITTAMLVQSVVAEAVSDLIGHGIDPPIYVSANIAGGHERNMAIEARYDGRLRRPAS